jgi:LPXTG-motif cell wall-anchored protein
VDKVTFTNTHFGYAEIQKSTNTGKDLGGWKFNIYTDADCTQKVTGSPFTTDNAGKMSVRLLPGTYFVQEVDESAAKPDWVFDTKVHVVTVKAGETVSVTLKNDQMGRAKLIKAMPDGGPVSGWVFDIYRKSDNAHMGTFTSSEDGTILSDWMLPGEYLVYEQLDEQSVYWCESENPQAVTIKAGETAEVTFTNRLKPGKIAIQKVDVTGKPLAGAEFLLEWSVDGKTWQPVSHTDSQYVLEGTCTSAGLKNGRLISGADGLVEFIGLHPERLYRLTETAAPEGYQLLADTAYEGGLPADKDLVIQLTVVNVPTFELPKTGSKSMLLMPISLALAAALCGAILVIGKRKKL